MEGLSDWEKERIAELVAGGSLRDVRVPIGRSVAVTRFGAMVPTTAAGRPLEEIPVGLDRVFE
jgi:hypothetical protein